MLTFDTSKLLFSNYGDVMIMALSSYDQEVVGSSLATNSFFMVISNFHSYQTFQAIF